MSEAYVLHRALRGLAKWAIVTFFTEIHVIGSEHVPKDGPIIVTATHHNMMIDPAILSCIFPHQRILHYWAKASLFANPAAKYILTSAGNIPVDRKASDRRQLLQGTLHSLAAGEVVALFPEGTSYTEPRIMQVKDGAAWAALEYCKWARDNPDKVRPGAENLTITTAAIVYTNKTKYRSRVITEFGSPITLGPYMEQFLSSEEGAPRAAVKKLTAAIEQQLVECTINAPDWDTLYAATMARDLLWNDENSVNLDDFVHVSQTLVDLFATPDLVPNVNGIKRNLLTYYSLLQTTHLTNSVLSSLPLPKTLDPHRPTTLPSRLFTLMLLLRDSIALLVRLPLFVVPLLIHAPAYAIGRFGAGLAEDEEETQAQNKVVFGLLFLLLMYPATFYVLWSLLSYTSVGAVIAVSLVYMFAVYHNRLINDTYEHAKRLVAAWRVLVGVWAPKNWDMSLSAMAQYATPRIPPENPWIDRSRIKSRSRPSTPALTTPPTASATSASPTAHKKPHRPPSRRLVRHLLRARVEAAKSLASLFAQLERPSMRVRASAHLARAYGGSVDQGRPSTGMETSEGVEVPEEPSGWRSAHEVIGFLRARGAKIAALDQRIEGQWAALSEGEESDVPATGGSEKDEDIVWVPSSQHESPS